MIGCDVGSQGTNAALYDADGTPVAPGANVWTGTNAGGRRAEDCDNWSTSNGSIFGTSGDPTRHLDAAWTDTKEPRPCDTAGLLLCFEN